MKRWLFTVVCVLFAVPVFAQASLLGDVAAERAKYGASMSPAQVAAMLNQVAWNHRAEGWGLLRKGAGNSCPLGGTFISCDILIHAPSIQHFDVLQDAENTARPQWNLVGPCVIGPSSGCDMSNFLAPMDPGGSSPVPVPTPTPVPVPVPVYTDLSGIYARFDDNTARLERMFAQWQLAEAAERERDAKLADKVDNPGWFSKVFGNRYVQMILAGAGTYVGQKIAK